MTTTTQRPQTQAAIVARHRKIGAMLDRVRATTMQMTRDHALVTIQAISRRADVSRAFLYQNAQARALVADALTKAGTQRQHAVHAANQATELVWRERALNAEDALKTAHDEIRTQRAHIAEFLGRIRDLPRRCRPTASNAHRTGRPARWFRVLAKRAQSPTATAGRHQGRRQRSSHP